MLRMFCSEEKILKSGLINCRAQLMAIDIAISVIILRVSIHRVTSLFRMLDKYLLKLIVPMSTANVSRTLPTQETNSLRLRWRLVGSSQTAGLARGHSMRGVRLFENKYNIGDLNLHCTQS